MKQRNFDPKLVPSYMLANKLDTLPWHSFNVIENRFGNTKS
jgi:hypothetical protein